MERAGGTATSRGSGDRRGERRQSEPLAGAHYDQYTLASPKYLTDNWMSGGQGALSSDARGKTSTSAVWAQDVWRFAPDWTATLGLRYEWWRAFDGYKANSSVVRRRWR